MRVGRRAALGLCICGGALLIVLQVWLTSVADPRASERAEVARRATHNVRLPEAASGPLVLAAAGSANEVARAGAQPPLGGPRICSAFRGVACERALRVLVVADGRPGAPDNRLESLVKSMRRCHHNVTMLHPTAEDGGEAGAAEQQARADERMAALLGATGYSHAALASVSFAPRGAAVWNGVYRLRAPWKVAALCGAMQFDALIAPVRLEYGSAAPSTAELVVPRLLRSLNGSDIKPFVALLVDRAQASLERSLASAGLDGLQGSVGERAKAVRKEWAATVGSRLASLYRFADFVVYRTEADGKAEKALLPSAGWLDQRKPAWRTHVLHLAPADYGPTAAERARLPGAAERTDARAAPHIALVCDTAAFGVGPVRAFVEEVWPQVHARLASAAGAAAPGLSPSLLVLGRWPVVDGWAEAATLHTHALEAAAGGAGGAGGGDDDGEAARRAAAARPKAMAAAAAVRRIEWRSRREASEALVSCRVVLVLAPADTGAPADEVLLALSLGLPLLMPSSAAVQLGEAIDGYDSLSGAAHVYERGAKLGPLLLRLYGSSVRLRQLADAAQQLWAHWLERRPPAERKAVSAERDAQQLLGKLCALVQADAPPVYTLHKKELDADAKAAADRARQHAGGANAHVRTLRAWAARVAAGDSCFSVHFGSQRATCCSSDLSSASDRMVITYGAMQSSAGLSHEVTSAEAEQRCANYLHNKHTWVQKKARAARAKQDAQVRAEHVGNEASTWEESAAADSRSIDALANVDLGSVEPDDLDVTAGIMPSR